MKFEQFLKTKGISSLNESNNYTSYDAVNEEGGALEGMMKMLTSMIAYGKFNAMYPKYKDFCYDADSNIVAFSDFSKIEGLRKKQEAIEKMKATEGLPREKKEQLIKQYDKLQDAMDTIDTNTQVKLEKTAQDRDTFKTDLDEEVAKLSDNLKTIAAKKITTAGYEAKLAGLEKKAIMDKKNTKDASRIEKTQKELQEIKQKLDDAVKALDDAEEAGAGDLAEVESVDKLGIKTELETFMASAQKMKAVKMKLKGIWDKAEGENVGTESEDYLLNYDPSHLFEDTKEQAANKRTSKEVLDHISGIPAKDAKGDDTTETKKGLYGELAPVAEEYVKALELQATNKAAIWAKVKGKPSTKEVILIAGGDPESVKEQPDGLYTCDKLSAKWEKAIDDKDNWPAYVEAKEVFDTATEKAGESAPATKTNPTEVEGEEEEEEEVVDDKAAKKQETIDRLKAKLNDPNLSDGLKAKIQTKIEKLENEADESVDYDSILEEIESLIAEDSTQAPKAIMKFADFIASKK